MWESHQLGRQARTGTITRTMTRQIIVEIVSSELTSQKTRNYPHNDRPFIAEIDLSAKPTWYSAERRPCCAEWAPHCARSSDRSPDFATRRASTTELREADPRIESRDFATTNMGIYSTKSRTDRLLAATTYLRSSLVATNRGQRVPPDPSGRLLRRMSQSPFVCRSGGRRLCGPRRGAKPCWTRTSQEIPVLVHCSGHCACSGLRARMKRSPQ